jgi:MFS transporter, DHA2 family, multidrug resistance protein
MVVGISFLHYSRMTLDTDFEHWALARSLQGLGYAFFFVPLSVLAYSQLAPEENNKASSLTNFFRNWGGSFGIALVTIMSDRRASFHQSIVGANQTLSTVPFQTSMKQITAYSRYTGFPIRTPSMLRPVVFTSSCKSRPDSWLSWIAFTFWVLGR